MARAGASRTTEPDVGDGFARPRVVISRCIDFEACRYNGQVIRASLREQLQPHMELVPICPELEIGLGVPRDPIRLVAGDRERDGLRLVQPSTGRDLTDAMEGFSQRWLAGAGAVDGFILKSRSPSCGVGSAEVHPTAEDGPPVRRSGMFAARVQETFPGAAIEEETRLDNVVIRDHFLTRLFTLAAFREQVRDSGDQAAGLVGFHARKKLLLTAFDQTRMRAMGRIVAEQAATGLAVAVDRYGAELAATLARAPRIPSNVDYEPYPAGLVRATPVRLSTDSA